MLELGDVFFMVRMDSGHGNWMGGIVGMEGCGERWCLSLIDFITEEPTLRPRITKALMTARWKRKLQLKTKKVF